MEWVGVDISKARFDAALPLGNGKYRTRSGFANALGKFDAFFAWLDTHCPQAAVVMEATGVYHELLAEALYSRGCTVYVVNPAQIAAFAKSELARTKTDRYDAKLIARFGQAHGTSDKPLTPFQPTPPAMKRLNALLRRLSDLQTMWQMEQNRLDVADASVQPSIASVLVMLDQQIKETQAAIRRHIDDDPDLRHRKELLNSIPGVADLTSAWLLTLLQDGHRFSRVAQAVAFVGLNPRVQESGQWKGHTRISKTGNAELRAKLYMPAVVARTHNPLIQSLCQRLAARGKAGKQIIVAAMRKLIHIAWGVLKNNTPFDPTWGLAA
ncbi:MAG: IS110 family transposase [Xanthomonadales bacterium]|nr:IS110 family transposase [Xanthomonadales bacterium]